MARQTAGRILEIGAGNLNHLAYQRQGGIYDAVEPFVELLADSAYRSRVRHVYSDIQEVPPTESYDTILSIAVLEHLIELPFVVARAGLLLKMEGSFLAGFPSEGGALWGLAWRLTTGIEYRIKRGLDYGAIMHHEHVNDAAEILTVLRYLFERVEVSRFPLPWNGLSFYTVGIASHPHLERCRRLCGEQMRREEKPIG